MKSKKELRASNRSVIARNFGRSLRFESMDRDRRFYIGKLGTEFWDNLFKTTLSLDTDILTIEDDRKFNKMLVLQNEGNDSFILDNGVELRLYYKNSKYNLAVALEEEEGLISALEKYFK